MRCLTLLSSHDIVIPTCTSYAWGMEVSSRVSRQPAMACWKMCYSITRGIYGEGCLLTEAMEHCLDRFRDCAILASQRCKRVRIRKEARGSQMVPATHVWDGIARWYPYKIVMSIQPRSASYILARKANTFSNPRKARE